MELLEAHDRAMEEFDRRVHLVRADQWQLPTPCTEWTVRDLVNHLVGEQLWAPLLLRGATVEEVGDRFDGDQLGDDPVGTWQRAARNARDAFERPDALDDEVEVSFGTIPATDYGWQMTMDLTVHAWDLARAIGDDDALDAELAEAVYTVMRPEVSKWQSSGIFAPPITVPADADPQTRLIALVGRDPRS
ncbi:TIGR03086 family metal-binding protein [Allokutzneria sp. A3M-2-11 16]|uniref:TIGR03086 family metal-binding protein n=1 Tax=Allokutzneria sp. A3M-2-11 16 TaxID=2962043 RepID=UPI0020B660CB|nr:TIGR03086 family metal-binding protein [Allokutzneria sp. A3M-2-11 16]MCP3799314.1 TIGR03086 family metal-binding protein [Allokutzneria sp. A3M-2-11 16]